MSLLKSPILSLLLGGSGAAVVLRATLIVAVIIFADRSQALTSMDPRGRAVA